MTNPKDDISALGKSLGQRAEAVGLSQVELARKVGASQGQISRLFAGKVARASQLLKDLERVIDAHGHRTTADAVCRNEDLVSALTATWDGTPSQARSLAIVIRSLRPLLDSHTGGQS